METGRGKRNMIFGKTEVKYFCAKGWTGVMGLEFLAKNAILAQHFFVHPSVLRQWAGSTAFRIKLIA
jgi:hypothetical protein